LNAVACVLSLLALQNSQRHGRRPNPMQGPAHSGVTS
jgi:hypothetical protein